MKVKICGITRAEDALQAVALGANMLGFIFAQSPRRASIQVAADLAAQLSPEVLRVGVFVNSPLAEITATVAQGRLTGVQLHGGESLDFLRQVRAALPGLFLIRALEINDAENSPAPEGELNLIDAPREDRRPLSLATLKAMKLARPFMLAGGLNSTNVNEYIATLKPDGIDLSSGVESAPGVKSALAMKALFEALRGAGHVA